MQKCIGGSAQHRASKQRGKTGCKCRPKQNAVKGFIIGRAVRPTAPYEVPGSKINQDERFDLPTIGMETIKCLIESGGSTLAIESEKTIILDKDEIVALADKNNISIIAL